MYNVLIVSPYFLPYAGVGANRMSSLASFLGEDSEFNITVLKNNNESYSGKILAGYEHGNYDIIECSMHNTFLRNILCYIRLTKKILQTRTFDCIIISVGPFYTMPLIRLIKRKYKIPVILDIRDFWAHEPVIDEMKRKTDEIKSFIKDFLILRKSLKYANNIVVTDEGAIELLSRYYGEDIKKKCKVVLNGYDDKRLENNRIENCVNYCQHYEKTINMVIYGKFSEYISDRRLQELAQAISDLEFFLKHKITVMQIGYEEQRLKQILENKKLQYINYGYMQYEKGIQFIVDNANILLLSSDLKSVGYGTKIFDYIYINKPIVFLGSSETGLAKLISQFQNSFICSNFDEIFFAIKKINDERITHLYTEEFDKKKFGRTRQNEKYRNIIKSVIALKEQEKNAQYFIKGR